MRIGCFCLLFAVITALPVVAQQSGSGLRPGDAIKLTIWREPDMSGEILVQEDGRAVFPRLGPVVVVDKDIASLKNELIAEYEKTLVNPSIEIIVIRRITISGEVRTPGVFKVDPSMSITDALALAGGPTPNARRDRLILYRDGRRTTVDLNEALTVQELAVESGDQIYVPQRSWLARNWVVTLTTVSTLMTLGIALSR